MIEISSLAFVKDYIEQSKSQITTLFSDVDGTLIDSTRIAAQCHAEAAQTVGIDASVDEVEKFIGVTRIEHPDDVRAMYQKWKQLTKQEIQILIENYRVRFFAAADAGQFTDEKFPDVDELWAYLRSHNITIGIITNRSRALIMPQLRNVDIYYDALKSGTEGRKDEQLRQHLEELGIDDVQTGLVVGDRDNDIKAAESVGIIGLKIVRRRSTALSH